MKSINALVWLLNTALWIFLAMLGNACSKESSDDRSKLYGKWTDPEDGTVYRTLQLGDQIWLADNLNRGVMIYGVEDQQDNGVIEKYCYDNNPVLCEKYGGLYQWDEAMQYSTQVSSQGICPEGWHIPSDSEWKILEVFLGMSGEDANERLWRGIDQGVLIQPLGETGFEALMGGNRFLAGSFSQIGSTGYFWTSTGTEGRHAWRRGVNINEEGIYRSENHRSFGFSVRCIRY